MTPTDKPMTVDALMENTRLAWYLGQRYWQQADSESYAENRRSDLTLEKFNKLLESGRAAIEQYGKEQRDRLRASLDDWLYANGPNGWIDALRDDAGRYRKLRSADMTTRNRLEHYSNSALDVVLDALPAVGAV